MLRCRMGERERGREGAKERETGHINTLAIVIHHMHGVETTSHSAFGLDINNL